MQFKFKIVKWNRYRFTEYLEKLDFTNNLVPDTVNAIVNNPGDFGFNVEKQELYIQTIDHNLSKLLRFEQDRLENIRNNYHVDDGYMNILCHAQGESYLIQCRLLDDDTEKELLDMHTKTEPTELF